jgi:hypothetical protein
VPYDEVQPSLETSGSIAAVVAEVRAELARDRWAVLPNPRAVARIHAAAGLAHCCALAEEVIAAHQRGSELVARTLARSLFETWLVAYYIHHGGVEALEAVAGAYHHSIATQHGVIQEHDEALRREHRQVRRRNRKIETANAGIAEWNRRNPESQPKKMHDLLPKPRGVFVGWDDIGWLKSIPKVPPARLPLTEMVNRLRLLTREAGQEELFDVSYHLAYRGLSNFGAHANLFVLNAYLDHREGRGVFVKVSPAASVPSSFDQPNLSMSLLLLAGLSVAVLGDQDCECPNARHVLEGFGQKLSPP